MSAVTHNDMLKLSGLTSSVASWQSVCPEDKFHILWYCDNQLYFNLKLFLNNGFLFHKIWVDVIMCRN